MTDSLVVGVDLSFLDSAERVELRQCRAAREFYDSLETGPSRFDCEEHARARRAYWNGVWGQRTGIRLSWNRERFAERCVDQAAGRDVVVVRDDRWPSVLFLAFVLGPLASRVSVRIGSLPRPGFIRAGHVRRALVEADRVSAATARLAERLWRRFCDGDARGVEEIVTRSRALAPKPEALHLYSVLFPRFERRVRRVSPFDERLLRQMEGGWIDTTEIAGVMLSSLRDLGRDECLFERCMAWAGTPFVEQRETGERRPQLRLTRKGERLLREGMRDGDDIPPFEVGGAVAYGPEGWFVTSEGGGRWVRAR